MPQMRHAPAPFIAPITGDIDQKLSQIVGMINALQATNASPTYTSLMLSDSTGQTWAVTISSTGVLSTALVTR